MPETSSRLPFEIDDTIDPALVISRVGVPLVSDLWSANNPSAMPSMLVDSPLSNPHLATIPT
jgi:hypothetical protein